MPLAYRIANWTRYMPADARKCTVMQWVAVPIAHDGMGYIEIMAHPDGIRIVGGWLLILQTAARCPERGLLVSDGGRILRAREIALKTRAREEDIKLALEECCRQNWIEEVEVSGQYPDDIRTPSRLQDRTEQNKTRQDKAPRRHVADAPPSLSEVVAFVAEIDGLIPAEEFLDANARDGWMYGRGKGKGKPVMDWMAHYRQWNRRRLADQDAAAPAYHVPTQEQIAELKENQRG